MSVLCCSLVSSADEPKQGDQVLPSIRAVLVEAPPEIDGRLDDPCWQQATHLQGFWREDVDAPELEPTEAWICYDARAIYVAFRCHDSKPSEIRCAQKKRQGSLWRDDSVEFWLDVTDSGHDFYSFRVNPAGTQYDRVPGGTSEKIEWKGDWRAAASIDEGGWSAEMEIPFAILRYPPGQNIFRFDLGRRLAREEERALWPVCFARVLDVENCAKWTDIETPPVPFRYVLMPYALTVLSEDEQDRQSLTGGLDLKGTLPNGVVGLATYNPDFRNLEDVVETIDFTYVERWLPEYRPFFQEGSWYFPSSRIFYTRRIEELDWGAKAFGTVGRHRFGLLDAYRRGGENHLVASYEHLLSSQHGLDLSLVNRNVPDEPDNQAYSLGAYWNWPFSGGTRQFHTRYYGTSTQGEGGEDAAVTLVANLWRNRGFSFSTSYEAVQPQFNAADGYVPETGIRKFFAGVYHSRHYDEGALQDTGWSGEIWNGESEIGARRGYWTSYNWYWRNGQSLFFGTAAEERDGFDDVSTYLDLRWNRQDMYHTGHISHHWGEHYTHPYRYQSLSQSFHPTQRWSAELSAERVSVAGLDDDGNVIPPEWFRQMVITTTYDITDERTASARLVRRGSSTNIYAAYRQRVRRGMDLLVVAGDPNAPKWVSRLAVKAIWCL